MNKIKTLSMIFFCVLTFSLASCSTDDTYDEISADTELNIKSPIDPPNPNGDDDDPNNGG